MDLKVRRLWVIFSVGAWWLRKVAWCKIVRCRDCGINAFQRNFKFWLRELLIEKIFLSLSSPWFVQKFLNFIFVVDVVALVLIKSQAGAQAYFFVEMKIDCILCGRCICLAGSIAWCTSTISIYVDCLDKAWEKSDHQ